MLAHLSIVHTERITAILDLLASVQMDLRPVHFMYVQKARYRHYLLHHCDPALAPSELQLLLRCLWRSQEAACKAMPVSCFVRPYLPYLGMLELPGKILEVNNTGEDTSRAITGRQFSNSIVPY